MKEDEEDKGKKRALSANDSDDEIIMLDKPPTTQGRKSPLQKTKRPRMDKDVPSSSREVGPFSRNEATQSSTHISAEVSLSKSLFKSVVAQEIQERKREALGLDKRYSLGEKDKAPLTTSVEEAAVAKPVWPCPKCTFENPAEAIKCEICDGNRPTTKDSEVWSCSVCTFQNPVERLHCEMCENARS